MTFGSANLLPGSDPTWVFQAKAFSYVLNAPSFGSTSETPMVLVNNSGNTNMLIYGRRLVANTASTTVVGRYYLGPTVTGAGSAATPVNLLLGSAIGTGGTITSGPSVSANGTLVGVQASTAFVPDVSGLLWILPASTSLLVTLQASSTSISAALELNWAEVN